MHEDELHEKNAKLTSAALLGVSVAALLTLIALDRSGRATIFAQVAFGAAVPLLTGFLAVLETRTKAQRVKVAPYFAWLGILGATAATFGVGSLTMMLSPYAACTFIVCAGLASGVYWFTD